MRLFALFAGLLLSGCVSGPAIDYMRAEYAGVEVKSFEMPDGTYRIFDKPQDGKIMITPSLGRAAGMGMATGATFGAADDSQNLAPYRNEVETYLRSTERGHCRITTGTLLVRPQYEFTYDCTPLPQPSKPDGKVKQLKR